MNIQFGLAAALATTLAHAFWQILVLGVLAAASLTLLRHRSAALRHLAGMVWLLSMLAAPVTTFVREWGAFARSAPVVSRAFEPLPLTWTSVAAGPSTEWALVAVTQLWLLGVVLVLLLQVGAGFRLLHRLERAPSNVLPREWQRKVDALSATLGIGRKVTVRLAAGVASPFTARCLRPVIWLPLTMLTGLPAAQAEALLAHELAHICRLDWLWNGVQCIIESLLFFHPAMWWLSREVRQCREHACDDLAVGAGSDSIALAEALAGLMRQRLAPAPVLLGAGGGVLLRRMAYLLMPRAPAQPWRLPATLMMLFASGALLAMQVAPPARLLSEMRLVSSGTAGHGDFREVSWMSPDGHRHDYRIGVDAGGGVRELYWEDGRPLTPSPTVYRWLDEHAAASDAAQRPPLPPLPPVDGAAAQAIPAVPVVPPAPAFPAAAAVHQPEAAPPPPPPPPPPTIYASAPFRALLQTIGNDGRLARLLGSSYAVDPARCSGSMQLWKSREIGLTGTRQQSHGEASVSAIFVGPRGRARIDYTGTLRDGRWNTTSLAIASLADTAAQR